MSHLQGKKIAILGGTGTLGKALTKEISKTYPDVDKVLVFSRDEIKQLEMMDDFPSKDYPFLDYVLGDVRDVDRLSEVLSGLDIVIHAAAIKHVVMAEKNPRECWKTNVQGTKNVIEACLKNQVDTSIFISTDKATNPYGVYGKSKLEAEELWKSANKNSELNFRTVRFGNIEDARGSVFEVFEKQKKTGTIKVTHPEATRYFISQKRAVKVILEMTSKDAPLLFTPEMKIFRILDLARKIAPDCKIEFIGLRPGDKLHEELDNNNTLELVR
ncbi:MAG: polysaccharide biosynthesis protein [Ekhidna sp.]